MTRPPRSPEPGPPDEAVFHAVRRLDPAPSPGVLAVETADAMKRTRASVAAAHQPAPEPGGPVAAYVAHAAPWGTIHVAASDGGLVAVELGGSAEAFVDRLSTRLRGLVVPDQAGLPDSWRSTLAWAGRELDEYFGGTRTAFDLPVDLRGVSAWDRLVLDGARSLVFGETTSYGRLAARIGRPRAARAVGGALGRNPVPIVIPCHRILAGDGSLGGYGGAFSGNRETLLGVKRTLLRIEGVELIAR